MTFWYLQGGYRIPALGQVRFELIVGVLLCGYALLRMLRRSAPPVSSDLAESRVIGWAGALLFLMFLMSALSVAPALSFNIFLDRAIKFSMIAFLIGSFVTGGTSLWWFLAAYLLAFAKMAQEGVTGYLTGSMVWENQGIPRLHGSTPAYGHPNSFSGTQLSTLPILASLFPVSPIWLRLVLGIQALAALTIVVVSGSRTGYVALLGWLLYRVAISDFKLKALAASLIACAAMVSIVPDAYIERFYSAFSGQEKEGQSAAARLEILNDAWTIFKDYPLGVGVGAFPIVRQRVFGRTQDTHNLYLEIATNLGIFGLLVFGCFVFSIFRTLRRTSDKAQLLLKAISRDGQTPISVGSDASSTSSELVLVRQVCQATTEFLVIRLLLGMFGMDLYEVYWWFAAGLTVALARIVGRCEATVGCSVNGTHGGMASYRQQATARRVPPARRPWRD